MLATATTAFGGDKTYKSGFLEKYKELIVLERTAKSGNKNMQLIFLGAPSRMAYCKGRTEVLTAVLFDPQWPVENENINPAPIQKIIYHKPWDGSTEWCGLLVDQAVENKKTGEVSILTREYRVDDDTANAVLELVAREGDWCEQPLVFFDDEITNKIQDSEMRDDKYVRWRRNVYDDLCSRMDKLIGK